MKKGGSKFMNKKTEKGRHFHGCRDSLLRVIRMLAGK